MEDIYDDSKRFSLVNLVITDIYVPSYNSSLINQRMGSIYVNKSHAKTSKSKTKHSESSFSRKKLFERFSKESISKCLNPKLRKNKSVRMKKFDPSIKANVLHLDV